MSLPFYEARREWLGIAAQKLQKYELSRAELIERVLHGSHDTPDIVYSAFHGLVAAVTYRQAHLCDGEHGKWYIPGSGSAAVDGIESRSFRDVLKFVGRVVSFLPDNRIGGMQDTEWHWVSMCVAALRYPSNEEYLLILALNDEMGALRAAVESIARSDRRRHVPALVFHRTLCRVTFIIVQRCGILAHDLNIDNDPVLFVLVLLHLFSGNSESLGYDPTIRYCPESLASFIRVRRTEYRILQHLTSVDGRFNRGTQCWKVQAPSGQIVVIKDWWHINSAKSCPKETVNLWAVRDVPNVPTYIDSDIVFHSAYFLNTYPLLPSAEQVRMVFSPFALSLENFRSRHELVGIFTDLAIGKYDVIFEAIFF